MEAGTISEDGDFPLPSGGKLQLTMIYSAITQLQRHSVFHMGKRGEISGPIRVLPISFSLKLQPWVGLVLVLGGFFHPSVYSCICPSSAPHPLSPSLLVAFPASFLQ